ncbi:MAG: energy transducer TonB [Chloracidobacterium sp.]|nr:energy transducer TonB [Chloracidobacterium sp.]
MKTHISIALAFAILVPTGIAFGQGGAEAEGIALFRDGKNTESAEALQNVVAAEGTNKRAWLYLGAAQLKLGHRADAAKAFLRSVFDAEDIKKERTHYDTPMKVTSMPRPAYTRDARSARYSGKIKVAVEFKADGTIGFTFPLEDLPHGLTDSAISAARRLRFKPAIKNGDPVTVVGLVDYSFVIQ